MATIAACVTAIAMTGRDSDDGLQPDAQSSPGAALPGLISFATPSKSGSPKPGGKNHRPSDRATTSEPEPRSSASAPPAEASKPAKPHPSSSDAKPASTWRSVRAVNYPDRYWHVSGDYVRLDPITSASARQDATFKLVKGLSDASCYSFATADGAYLRHRDFVLRSERNDGSSLFRQDATFCPRGSKYSGAVMLESVNYPGRYLRHQNFQLKLDPYQYSDLYRADSAFRLVDGLA